MVGEEESIGYLHRVTLEMDWGDGKVPFDFIFGIGAEGLSPFERELSGKEIGFEREFSLTRNELSGLFDHLMPPLFLHDIPQAFTLKIRVVHVAQADQREIIKAMAEASSCGTHCCGH
jgi:hypothetical protein